MLCCQSCPNLCNPMGCSPPGASVHGGSPGKNTGVVCRALLQGSAQTRGHMEAPALQADALPAEPPGKPHPPIIIIIPLSNGLFSKLC